MVILSKYWGQRGVGGVEILRTILDSLRQGFVLNGILRQFFRELQSSAVNTSERGMGEESLRLYCIVASFKPLPPSPMHSRLFGEYAEALCMIQLKEFPYEPKST